MLRCSKCKGTNIEQKVWINPNDNTFLDRDNDTDEEEAWCRDCKDYVEFEDFDKDYTPDPFTVYKEWKEDNM